MIILLRSNRSFRGPFTHDPQPAEGETVTQITPDDYAALMTLGSTPAVFDNGFRAATTDEQIASADTLAKKLRVLLSALPPVSRATALGRLAAPIQWANDNGHSDSVPEILESFDPGDDAALIAAKAKVLAMIS